MKRVLFSAWFLFVLLPACAGSKQSHINKAQSKRTNHYIAKKTRACEPAIDSVRLQEAKLSDVPIPVSAKPTPEYFDPSAGAVMLGYRPAS